MWETCVPGLSYIRHHGDGSLTLLVVRVPPKLRPAWDGAESWTDPETWAVTVPPEYESQSALGTGFMWDKPHRITWLLAGWAYTDQMDDYPIPTLHISDDLSIVRRPYRGKKDA